jgi:hypothetical protein
MREEQNKKLCPPESAEVKILALIREGRTLSSVY